jgi:hypothetical protein
MFNRMLTGLLKLDVIHDALLVLIEDTTLPSKEKVMHAGDQFTAQTW